jgi:hypothetical protein
MLGSSFANIELHGFCRAIHSEGARAVDVIPDDLDFAEMPDIGNSVLAYLLVPPPVQRIASEVLLPGVFTAGVLFSYPLTRGTWWLVGCVTNNYWYRIPLTFVACWIVTIFVSDQFSEERERNQRLLADKSFLDDPKAYAIRRGFWVDRS